MRRLRSGVIGVGVVGLGYWGPNLVRNFADLECSEVVAVCDLEPARLRPIAARYPSAQCTTEVERLLEDPNVDAMVIATPAATHFDLAMSALAAGKHVLIEKPLASSVEQARGLVQEAKRRGRTLMVDHTFVYTGAVKRIREMLERGELGHPFYYDAVRVNLGLFRPDVNVLWDLAVHDLSILDHVVPFRPTAVSAHALSHISGQSEDIAYLTLFFEEPFIAHVHVNWLAPVKVRRTLIGGSRRMVVYDDLEADEKIKVYDSGVDASLIRSRSLEYRLGDMVAPRLDQTEALKSEAKHFIECIENGTKPITDGASGLRVVEMLQAADQSIANGGGRVTLEGAR